MPYRLSVLWVIRRSSFLCAVTSPCARRPERPDNQERLKEQADSAGSIAVEAECIDAIHILRDVAGKNYDEERCGDPAELSAVFPE